MKNKIIYLLLASLMILPGCADYLDQDPEELNSIDKIFTSDVDTRKWYARMYSDDYMVQEMHYSGQIPYFWCTDEAAYIMEGNIRNTSEGKMSPDNYYGYTGYNLYFFVRYYQAIRHINLFIENLDRCTELGESERRKYHAEARFMRAYYHWLLLRLYGPVPIVDRSRTGSELATPQARNTFAECIEWIDAEINWSCENGLPEARTANDLGLPDVGAARAIQSRMHLMAASPLYNGNTVYANWKNNDGTVLIPQTYNKELWKKAADAAKAVIDMGRYELLQPEADDEGNISFDTRVENIRKVTTTWGSENPEAIWSKVNTIQWYAKCALPARWYGWNARYSLPLGFINEFHMADGSRAPEMMSWFDNKQFSEAAGNGTIAGTFHMFVGREPRFYANIHFPNQRVSYLKPNETDSAQDAEGYGIVDFWFNGLSGHKYTTGDKNTTGFSVRKNISLKYWSSKQNSNDNWALNVPFPIIRLGEIYLNYAEALNEYYGAQKADEILYYLNAIRERAGIPGHEAYTTQEDMREKIRHERKIELSYECNRFFDVRRWFIAHGPQGVFNQNEWGLDMSRGSSPTIEAGGSTCTDPEFFSPIADVAIKRFDLKHYFMPIKASEVMLNTELVQAPFY